MSSTPASFKYIYTPTPSVAPGKTTAQSPTDVNSEVSPLIKAVVVPSNPYNFLLGTPNGALHPGTLTSGTNAIFPVDNGSPEYSMTFAELVGSDISTAPASLDPSVFSSWSEQQQAAYMSTWGLTQAIVGSSSADGADALYVSVDKNGALSTQTLTQYAQSLFSANIAAVGDPTAASNLKSGPYGAYAKTPLSQMSLSTFETIDASSQGNITQVDQINYLLSQGAVVPLGGVGTVMIGNGITPQDTAIVTYNAEKSTTVVQSLSTWGASLAAVFNSSGSLNVAMTGELLDLGPYTNVSPANLSASVFEGWTSEQQAEYLNYQNKTSGSQATSFVIGSGSTSVTAVLSASDPNMVYIVQNLTATQLAGMSSVDQTRIAATAAFANVATSLGLSIGNSVALANIQNEITAIVGASPTNLALDVTVPNVGPKTTVSGPPPIGASVTPVLGHPTQSLYSMVQQNSDGSVSQIEITFDSSTKTASYTDTNYTNSSGTWSAQVATGTGTEAKAGETRPKASNLPLSLDVSFTANAAPSAPAGVTVGPLSSQMVVTIGQEWYGVSSLTATAPNTVSITPTAGGSAFSTPGMPDADRQVFIQELENLYAQVSKSPIIDTTQVSTELNAITTRFNTAATYYSEYAPQTSSVTLGSGATALTLQSGVVSTDANASIQSTYNTLMKQENAILSAMVDQTNLQSSAALDAPALDAPTAAMFALTDSMNSQQAVISQGTAQLQAIQQFLQNVSTMQGLVNYTVQTLGTSSTATTGFLGASTPAALNSSAIVQATGDPASTINSLISMFDTTLNNGGTNISPILKQFGITMPAIQIFQPGQTGTLTALDAQGWNGIGTQLSNLVTQLQQQSQMLTTQINQETQQMNNTYTEMTGIVGQMGTVVNTIGTNIA